MHLNYKVRLDDHDFAVGERHQLTPSVYAGIITTAWVEKKLLHILAQRIS